METKKNNFFNSHYKWPQLILEIGVFALALLFFAPFYLVIINSAKPMLEITENPLGLPADFIQIFRNVQLIIDNPNMGYVRAFFNSLIITTSSLVAIGVSSAMAAWVLVRNKTKVSFWIFMLFISGMVIPFQVVMLPLVQEFDMIQVFFHIEMKDTYHGVILAYMGFGAPLSIFLFHGFIKSIPFEIEEAAIIDGCSKPQVFFRIVLPMLKPIFVTLLVLNGMWIWNDYLLPVLTIGLTGDVRTLPVAVANLAGSYLRQWDLILTAVLMAFIPVFILFIVAQKHIIKGMTSGAIK